MAIALHHSRAKGTARLVLLGIANHDGDGGAWPTVKTLAKYAACSVSQVQRNVAELERLGEIKRFIQAGGDHNCAPHDRPNRYHFLLQCPHDCDRTKNHRTRNSDQRILDLDPEQLEGLEGEGVAPMRPGQTGSHPREGVAPMRPAPVAPMRPKPPTQTTNHLPETKPAYRVGARTAVWADDRCPGNWKTSTHALGGAGKCEHCHERPAAYANPETGETL
ncbi:MAG: hypothetical protein K0R01_163 [Mycobacterium sp.]|jgi:hypothetical protein|nr:hypothetical protein [Mycobacterium sp.]